MGHPRQQIPPLRPSSSWLENWIPVIIHSREAVEDTMRLLNQYRPKGVVHCFSGSVETAKEVLRLGMYIGVTGVITFKTPAASGRWWRPRLGPPSH